MTRTEHAAYWRDTALNDDRTMRHLLASGDNIWALFMAHLVLEKLFKAILALHLPDGQSIPRSHDLLSLAQKAGLAPDEHMTDMLDTFTSFNIEARYPDYKQAFYRTCDQEYTQARVKEMEVIMQWLLAQIPS